MSGPTSTAEGRRYAFLASSPYSGSTLLSFLLARHPRVSTISDVSGTRRRQMMSTFRCSCGRLMRACPFWARLADQSRERGIPDLDLADFRLGFDTAHRGPLQRLHARSLRWSALEHLRDRALAPLGVDAAMREVGRRSWALANAVMDITRTDVFVDASKERLRIRYLERHLPVRPLVIHLVRDVRGVVESTLRRGKVDERAATIARGWARTNDSIERQLRELPADRAFRVRYEDLCQDVPGVLRSAFAFLGVDPDASLRPIGREQHMLGNQMRLVAPSDIRLDERWRGTLDPRTEEAIVTAATPVFARLYPERATLAPAGSSGQSSRR
jgi:hypothetical protein